MIKSMTGFSRCEGANESVKITVDIKSVNNRFLELNTRIPKALLSYEYNVKNELKAYMTRGRIDVSIGLENIAKGRYKVEYDSQLAHAYMEAVGKLKDEFEIKDEISLYRLTTIPEIIKFTTDDTEDESILELLLDVVRKAGEAFVADRLREGENLEKDLMLKLDLIEEKLNLIIEKAPVIMAAYREKLFAKLKDVIEATNIDENRIATEAIIYADKVCVDEETVRLKSHIAAMRKELSKSEPVGKKLDFLAQEMNREANTILSKSSDLETTDWAVDIKTEIEKVREQIQNVE